MDYSEYALKVIQEVRPKIEEARKIASDILGYPDKLDKKFYLEIQDRLSILYDEILEKYLQTKTLADDGNATVILALKKKYETGKAPTSPQQAAEATIECSDINMAEALLEAYYKSIKNYLQTTRSHIMAVSGKEENEED
jgi:hypothetical protein